MSATPSSSSSRTLTLAPAPSAAHPAFARKPMATARRVTLFEREVRYRLSAAALDILFDAADVLSEGQIQGDRYFGSTMITFELARVAPRVREDCDLSATRRVADLLAADPRAQARARAIATAQAESRAGSKLGRLAADLSVRVSGSQVQIDIDVESGVGRMVAGRAR